MSLSAIRKLENPAMYQLAMHFTIVQKRHCNPPCLPTLTKNMLADIYVISMLLKHPMKYISTQESSVVIACPQSTQDQSDVHFRLVSALVIFHWLV